VALRRHYVDRGAGRARRECRGRAGRRREGYGGGLNLNPHYHLIGLDGWFVRNDDGSLVSHEDEQWKKLGLVVETAREFWH
jgi:hypothetical protein